MIFKWTVYYYLPKNRTLKNTGKMAKNTGKVREKSGNFVSPEKWEPWDCHIAQGNMSMKAQFWYLSVWMFELRHSVVKYLSFGTPSPFKLQLIFAEIVQCHTWKKTRKFIRNKFILIQDVEKDSYFRCWYQGSNQSKNCFQTTHALLYHGFNW